MRLPSKLDAERQTFVSELFRRYPDLTIRAAQQQVIDKYGRQMRPRRLLDLRKQAREVNLSQNLADHNAKTLLEVFRLDPEFINGKGTLLSCDTSNSEKAV